MSIFNRFSNFIYQIKDNVVNHFFEIPGMLLQWCLDTLGDIKDIFKSYLNSLIEKFAHRWPVIYFLSQETKNNLLWCEIGNQDLKKAQIFIDAGADVNFSHASDPSKTVLGLACDNMDLYLIKALLKAGANANNEQLLVQAIHHSDIDLLNTAIAAGVNVNAKIHGNTTVLMNATQIMNLNIVKALIKAGANPMATKCVAGRFVTMLNILFAAPERTYSNNQTRTEIGTCLLDAMTPEHIQFTFNQPAYDDSAKAAEQKNLTKQFIMRHQIRQFQNDLLTQVFDFSSVDQKDTIFNQLNKAQTPIELLPQFFSKKYPLFTPEIAAQITQKTYAEYSEDKMAQSKKLNCRSL